MSRATKPTPNRSRTFTYAGLDVIRVLDGDTLDARVDVGFGIQVRTLIRLVGIDAPERKRGTRALAERVTYALALALVANPGQHSIRSHGWDKYGGRILGSFLPVGSDTHPLLDLCTQALIGRGVARSYAGGEKKPWTAAELQRADTGAQAWIDALSAVGYGTQDTVERARSLCGL